MSRKILFVIFGILCISSSIFCIDLKREFLKSEKENSNLSGLKLVISTFSRKDEVTPFSKVNIILKDGSKFTLLTDENGKQEVWISKELILEQSPKIKFTTNCNKKIRVKLRILPIKKIEYFHKGNSEVHKNRYLEFLDYKALNINVDHLDSYYEQNELYVKFFPLESMVKHFGYGSINMKHLCFFDKFLFNNEEVKEFNLFSYFKKNKKQFMKFQSDGNGMILFFCNSKWLDKDPEFAIVSLEDEEIELREYYKSVVNLKFRTIMKMNFSSEPDFFILNDNQYSLKDKRGNIILRNISARQRIQAKSFLERIDSYINKIFDIYKIDIYPKKAINVVLLNKYNKYYLINEEASIFSIDELSDKNLLVVMHELSETYVCDSLNMYKKGTKYSRWIGDGIAELMRYEVFKLQNEDRSFFEEKLLWGIINSKSSQLDHYIEAGEVQEFDLKKWEAGNIEQKYELPQKEIYIFSMYFWYKLNSKYGKGIISEFIEEGTKLKQSTDEELIEILSEITKLDINKETVLRLDEVQKFIEAN